MRGGGTSLMANKENNLYGRPKLFIELEFYILFLIGVKG